MKNGEMCHWHDMELPSELRELLTNAKSVVVPKNKAHLIELALGNTGSDSFDIEYEIPGKGLYKEAQVDRCRNGISVNYSEAYMRRRDPDCMVIADKKPTDKKRYEKQFSVPFDTLRAEILAWLGKQDLVLMPFYAGSKDLDCGALLVGPANASFFAGALADIQGMIPREKIVCGWKPEAVIYLAPVFRHTHCGGKQIVIHHRLKNMHEMFSLNLYPGPSAKKGVYSVLISLGEKQGWITAHGATVKIITPYDNEFVIMHEGASGGGKSEMLQYPHREPDGRLLLGQHVETGKKRYVPLFQGCTLNPVTDDMALCHTKIQNDKGYLVVRDAEEGWFVRVDHITRYGVDLFLEELCATPPEPLVFLNLYSVPKATCLIWEHTQDEPNIPCPNPRVILPRSIVPNIVNEPVEVNVRSFGVRTPPCTAANPSYGILGILHVLPRSIAWLWRLVSPRGYANPSITDSKKGMSSEGVGSYWPFATGRRVDQANLLLQQILQTPKTRYTLTPNQHIGAWKTGFMPQWIAREYLARRGSAQFRPAQLDPARCPLLGYAFNSLLIEGFSIHREFLQVNVQEEVGDAGYDKGAKILTDFFKQELAVYLQEKDLDSLGKKIIECCLNDGSLEDYIRLIPSE